MVEGGVGVIAAVGEMFTLMGDALALFTKEPTVYFTALALAGALIGTSRKLIPMRRR